MSADDIKPVLTQDDINLAIRLTSWGHLDSNVQFARLIERAAIQADRASRAEPVAWRIRHRPPPGMTGNYPWGYTEIPPGALDARYECEPLRVGHSPQGDATDDWIEFGKRFAIDLSNTRAAAEMVHKGAGEGPYEALLIGIELLAQHARLAMRGHGDA